LILVCWIDFFRGVKSAKVDFLEKCLSENENIAICGVILTECLQGVPNDKQFIEINNLFSNLIYLEIPKDTYIKAAQTYRDLRKAGITIRTTIDCIIYSVSKFYDCALLHNDRDFDLIFTN